MFTTGEPKSHPLSKHNWQEHEDFLFAIDCLNAEYYWEAHAYLEAVWNENGRKDHYSDLCKALIKIGAAGVKIKRQEEAPAKIHLERAEELLNKIRQTTGENQLCGINLKMIPEVPCSINLVNFDIIS